MYGARAVLKEVVERYSSTEVRVHVVWLPMVPGDDNASARSTGRMFAGHEVRQFYDDERAVGLAYRSGAFSNCLQEAIAALPKDHPLNDDLREWARIPQGEGPLWDAVLFYPAGVEWDRSAPYPVAWSKQVGFFGEDAGEVTGVFFRNDCRRPPVDSDWGDEVRDAMTQLLSPPSTDASP